MPCSRSHIQVKLRHQLFKLWLCLKEWFVGLVVTIYSILCFICSAIDIKELKILDIRNGNARNSSSASTKLSSAPVAVPKGDPRSVEKLNSPQHCSKSYGERHLDVPGQPKGFRRRHNSCKCNALRLIREKNADC